MDMYKIPDGLHELCADISMEVIRIQPDDIYCFIANYLDILTITRENTKVAVKVVRDIVLNSEQIVEVLSSSGLELKEIAAAAPRLQEAFRTYLEIVDASKKECGCEDDNKDNESEISICRILKENGATDKKAKIAAKKIQSIFRGHYEQLLIAEERGEIQWQRADLKTKQMLIRMNITEANASHAASIIQNAYRKYYLKKNEILDQGQRKDDYKGLKKVIDMASWLEMMFENFDLTTEQANKAAIIIQKAYRRYRIKKYHIKTEEVSKSLSSNQQEVTSIKDIKISNENIEEIEKPEEQLLHIDKEDLKSLAMENIEKKVEANTVTEKEDRKSESGENIESIKTKIEKKKDDKEIEVHEENDELEEQKIKDDKDDTKNELDEKIQDSDKPNKDTKKENMKSEVTDVPIEP